MYARLTWYRRLQCGLEETTRRFLSPSCPFDYSLARDVRHRESQARARSSKHVKGQRRAARMVTLRSGVMFKIVVFTLQGVLSPP